MRRFVVSLLAVGATLMPLAPAAAFRVATPSETFDAGRCIVVRNRDAALDLLRTLPNNADMADLTALPGGLSERCARGLTSADALHLRGAIVQEMYLRDFGGAGVEPRRSARLIDLALPVQDSAGGDRTTELFRLADCVVRNDGEHVDRFLASSVGSRIEANLIGAMRNYLAACAPATSQFAVRPADLRAVIAQSAYHSMYRYWTARLAPVDY